MAGPSPAENGPPLGSAHEQYRIKVLREYAVLDSEPEREFDDLAAMAAHICRTPIALISLVDAERQWFKAKVGLESRQTPRSESFCAHALDQQNEVLIVPDATIDDRFAQNPLVTGEPGIRFYAGAPLVSADHATIGTLCVIDRVARELSPAQKSVLTTLAQQVVGRLERRRQRLQQAAELPAGIHDRSFAQAEALICSSLSGRAGWLNLLGFLGHALADDRFSHACLNGDFIGQLKAPSDWEVTLQISEPYGAAGFAALQDDAARLRRKILDLYSVQLNFWLEGLPPGISVSGLLRAQPPWMDVDPATVRIIRIDLRHPEIVQQFRQALYRGERLLGGGAGPRAHG